MSLEEEYKRIEKEGELMAFMVSLEKFEEIWLLENHLYSVEFDRKTNKIISIKAMGENVKEVKQKFKCDICLKEIEGKPYYLDFTGEDIHKKEYSLCFNCYTSLWEIIHKKIKRSIDKATNKEKLELASLLSKGC
jgi:hypothetical protein